MGEQASEWPRRETSFDRVAFNGLVSDLSYRVACFAVEGAESRRRIPATA